MDEQRQNAGPTVEAGSGEKHSAVIVRGISMPPHQVRMAIDQAVAREQLSEEDGEEVSWEPVYDGKYFMGDPVDMGYRKETIGTPMIIGTCFSEFAGTHDRNYDEQPKALWSEEKADAIIARTFGDKTARMNELFAKAYPDRQKQDLLFVDLRFRKPAMDYIKGFTAAGGKIWNYMFNLETPYNYGTTAWHNAEECYCFRNAAYLEYEYIPEVSGLKRK